MTRQSVLFSFIALIILSVSPGRCLGQDHEAESGQSKKTALDNPQTKLEGKSVNPKPIQGIFITGNEADILKKGRQGVSGIQIDNLEIPGGAEHLKEILQSHISKESSRSELTEILKDITSYYRSNKIPAVTVKVYPKAPYGVVQILVSKKPKKTVPVIGFFVTGKEENILKQGRTGISDVQIVDLNLPEGDKGLKAIILPFISKKMTKEVLTDLQKQILLFYRTNHLPPVVVKITPKRKTGIVQILIAARPKKPLAIKGIYVTEKEDNILKEGRKGQTEIQIADLQIPGGEEQLKAVLTPFIGKTISKEELSALQKKIIHFYHDNKLPPISVKISPKKTGGVLQILIKKAPKKEGKKGAGKGAKKEGKGKDGKHKHKHKPIKPFVVKGIFVTSNRQEILKEGRQIEGVVATQLFVPFCTEQFECYLSSFIGITASDKELKDLRKKLIHYFHRMGKKFNLHVEFKIKNGVIQALITERRIGHITYEGTKWMSEDQIAHIFDIHEGEVIDKERIRNNFAWLNQNAFHKSKIKFTPSKVNKGDVDIKLTTKDAFPLRFTLSGDNTGTPSLGRERFAAGVTWGNAFFQDDVLSYNYGMSNIPERYYSHTGNYLTYLPWKHKFSVFGNYSKSRPALKEAISRSFSNQCRVRYTIPFKPLYTRFQHSVAFGFDVKYGNGFSLSRVKPNAKPSIKKGQISQLVGNYTLTNATKKHNLAMILNLYWSPGRLFEHQTTDEFQARRNWSRVDYAYFNLYLTDIYKLPHEFSLAGALTVQKSTGTLPGSELLCIGGYNTVRGYRPCEYSADSGLIANLELRTPTMKPIKHFNKKLDDALFFLLFVDYGIGYNYNHQVFNPKLPQDKRTEWALGTGLGLRYQIQQYLSFRCDYGFKCHHMFHLNKAEKRQRGGNGELHVGLLLSY